MPTLKEGRYAAVLTALRRMAPDQGNIVDDWQISANDRDNIEDTHIAERKAAAPTKRNMRQADAKGKTDLYRFLENTDDDKDSEARLDRVVSRRLKALDDKWDNRDDAGERKHDQTFNPYFANRVGKE